jgi:uncharacterized membrane protein YraQ (UPF0718 family)
VFNIFAIILIGILLLIDKDKTIKGIKRGFKKILKNTPLFINMIIIVSISLYFISDDLLLRYLGSGDYITSIAIALGLGSITFMPGFIVFPLSGLLVDKGIDYIVIAAFTTSMMMVGVTTFQIEKSYFGTRLTIIRNVFGLIMAVIVSLIIGIGYGGLI